MNNLQAKLLPAGEFLLALKKKECEEKDLAFDGSSTYGIFGTMTANISRNLSVLG